RSLSSLFTMTCSLPLCFSLCFFFNSLPLLDSTILWLLVTDAVILQTLPPPPPPPPLERSYDTAGMTTHTYTHPSKKRKTHWFKERGESLYKEKLSFSLRELTRNFIGFCCVCRSVRR